MTRLLAAALLLVTLVGCGRAGPPVRRQPAPPQLEAPSEDDEQTEEKQP